MRRDWITFFRINFIWFALLFLAAISLPFFANLRQSTRGTHHVSGNPQRIVSLAPNITEILFALGLGDKLVAVSNDSDYPPEVADINKVSAFWQPSLEPVLATKPDLVITLWFPQQKSVADTLKGLGYPVLVLRMETFSELYDGIKQIGIATARKEQAEKLAADIENKINKLQTKYHRDDKPKVLWVIEQEPLRVAGKNTFLNELIEAAGGQNAIGETLQQYPSISTEEILSCGADVIIQSAMNKKDIEFQQKRAEVFWSEYKNIPAVKNEKIFILDSDEILRLGPRLPPGIETIAHCLYSDNTEEE